MTYDGINLCALVVYFNSSAAIEQCLSSLKGEVSRIYVLENASTADGERDRLEELVGASPQIILQTSDINLGFGGGINLLARSAIADGASHLWLVNPDCVVQPESGVRVAVAMSEEGIDIASPVVFSGSLEAPVVWFAGGSLDMRRGYSEHHVARPSGSTPIECSFISGAAMMVQTPSWETLDGFREDLFMYWEDAELCRRAALLSLKMAVVPGASVWHREGGSSHADEGHSHLYYYYMNRNRLAIAGGRFRRLDVLLGRGARMTIRLFAGSLRENADARGKAAASLRGALAGLRYPGDAS